jgi:tetratricopeptide (TPR) repeat protein
MTEQPSVLQLTTRYREMVQTLVKSKNALSPDQVLACLVTRDQIAHLWLEEGSIDPDAVQLIDQGDRLLRDLKEPISQLKELKTWRENFNPTVQAWWWHFNPPEGWFQRFDWLATAIAVVCLIISAGLITDIAPRYLSGGPDTQGAVTVIAQSLVVLLTTGSILTRAGQEAGKRILTSLRLPKQYWEEVGAILAFGVLIYLFIFRQSLPQRAIAYNDNGLANYCAGYLTSAQFDYMRALKLNPDYLEAHYNLGQLYEDLQNFKEAQTHYRVAAQGGLIVAYNKLAHLYILDKNYAAAIPFLLTGLDQIRTREIRDKLFSCASNSNSADRNIVTEAPVELLQYEMLKNLGWARLGQERYDEADPYLEEAINLFPDKAPAYCLRAQVREGQGNAERGLEDWETCLQYASTYVPDEDVWIKLARQKFQ